VVEFVAEITYLSPKYKRVIAHLFHNVGRNQHELTIWLKAPVHLYDIVWYSPPGPFTRYVDGKKVEEGYKEEETQGTIPYTTPFNMRLDVEVEKADLTEEWVDSQIDEHFRESIEECDGDIGLYKVIGVK